MLIARIEKLLLALVLSLIATITIHAAEAGSTNRSPRIIFIIGENEYHTWETLPEFAQQDLQPQGLDCSLVMASPKAHDIVFTSSSIIKGADLLFVSVRRRTPPKEMMALIRAHLKAGKPLIGIRTASHAFGADPPDAEHEGWRAFDREILG